MDAWNDLGACSLIMCAFILVCITTTLVGMLQGLGVGVNG